MKTMSLHFLNEGTCCQRFFFNPQYEALFSLKISDCYKFVFKHGLFPHSGLEHLRLDMPASLNNHVNFN